MTPVPTENVILFDHLGPYHLARLRAAAARSALAVVELNGESAEYDWQREPLPRELKIVTVSDTAGSSPRRVRERIAWALSHLNPRTICIPGWHSTLAYAALSFAVGRRLPVILMSESSREDSRRHFWREAVKKRLVRLCSSALVGGTRHEEYLRSLGMPAERVFRGYDAVENEWFSRGADLARARASVVRPQLRLPERYFLASARFIEKKNLANLIEAYARYRALCAGRVAQGALSEEPGAGGTAEDRPRTAGELAGEDACATSRRLEFRISNFEFDLRHLVLLGDGPLRSALQSQALALGLYDEVHFPGFRQYAELPAYYGLADAFIHPSSTEQWGLVVNEAMASGLPVLVSNRCGCAPDLVQEGRNGFTFDPANVDQLASLMLKLSAPSFHPSAKLMGQESRRIVARFGPDQFALGLQSAVDAAIQKGPQSCRLLDRLLLKFLLWR
jgi:glycosyltransferase involved in cell wall biosynthesis